MKMNFNFNIKYLIFLVLIVPVVLGIKTYRLNQKLNNTKVEVFIDKLKNVDNRIEIIATDTKYPDNFYHVYMDRSDVNFSKGQTVQLSYYSLDIETNELNNDIGRTVILSLICIGLILYVLWKR